MKDGVQIQSSDSDIPGCVRTHISTRPKHQLTLHITQQVHVAVEVVHKNTRLTRTVVLDFYSIAAATRQQPQWVHHVEDLELVLMLPGSDVAVSRPRGVICARAVIVKCVGCFENAQTAPCAYIRISHTFGTVGTPINSVATSDSRTYSRYRERTAREE